MVKLVKSAKNSFDGFVNNFYVKNVDVNKYFSASGSILSSAWGTPSILLDYSLEGETTSVNWVSARNNPVVAFTLKCPIYLTHYRLRARTDAANDFPVSWEVEGLSGSTWSTLDTKTDQEEIKGKGKAYTFSCSSPKTVKEIKLTATKTSGNNYLILSRVEFFGTMNIDQCPLPFLNFIINRRSCTCRKTTLHTCLYILMIMQ